MIHCWRTPGRWGRKEVLDKPLDLERAPMANPACDGLSGMLIFTVNLGVPVKGGLFASPHPFQSACRLSRACACSC